jgi:UDPglucose 6-dehydrogenase
MRICVLGLWHLGCVTAACAAEQFPVTACDPDPATIAGLADGEPPIFEPGLKELIASQAAAGRLTFTSDIRGAVAAADMVWVTFDTPVDEDDRADVEFVADRIRAIFPALPEGAVVLISSQVPVGFTALMEADFKAAFPGQRASFAYSPENLRLGAAIDAFHKAQRIVMGVRSQEDRQRLEPVMGRFCGCLEWMSVESAEMTKHALNAFLANSIAFINEIAAVGEHFGADAKEVERGLKGDIRIGPRAYLGAGGAFAGGTLARDVSALGLLADRAAVPAPLLKAIYASNLQHQEWPRRMLRKLLGNLEGKVVAILGLTYKPGTNTLRRSSAVELCHWLIAQGAAPQAYDPVVRHRPAELSEKAAVFDGVRPALTGADAVVVTTEWPEFKTISPDDLQFMRQKVIIDPNRFLDGSLRAGDAVVYAAVGYARERK